MKISEGYIEMIRPVDAHCHFRELPMIAEVLPFTSSVFQYGVAMGNTQKPIMTAEDVENYRNLIKVYSENSGFEPIMTVMLVKGTTPDILEKSFKSGAKVLKYIPAGTSTNSSIGGIPLYELWQYKDVIKRAEELGMIFSAHWELIIDPRNGKEIPEKDREEQALIYFESIVGSFPGLTVIAEHVSTESMIKAVKLVNKDRKVFGTVAIPHLFLTLGNALDSLGNVIDPKNYCKPVPKTFFDREAVRQIALSGNPRFFFGSDSAPHYSIKKQLPNPMAGIFSAPVAIPLLVQFFNDHSKLSLLENFTSTFAAACYGLKLDKRKSLVVKQKEWKIPLEYKGIPIFKGGEVLNWQLI